MRSTRSPVSRAEPASPLREPLPGALTVGTLHYSQRGIVVLFFWLLWNEFGLILFEQIRDILVSVIFKDNGASNRTIGFFTMLTGFLLLWLNPVVSTWSDRFRSRHGRRRPFLLLATPPAALCTALLPYMPDLGAWLSRFSVVAEFSRLVGISAPVLCLGAGFLLFSVFNGILLAIFSYYYWDVVPEAVLGRFSSLGKIVSMAAAFVWSFFLFGLAEQHLKVLCGLLALAFALVYLLSVWRVKEGTYPPPAPLKSKDLRGLIGSYFTDCFSDPRYLWIFGGFSLYQINNLGNPYQFYFQHYDLGIDMDTIGKFKALPSLLLFVVGYFVGLIADTIKPVRLMGPLLLLWSAANILSFYCVHDKWSFLLCNVLVQFAIFGWTVFLTAFTVEVFPREKLGQFCSANTFVSQLACALIVGLLGILFDHLQNNRLGYLWSAAFQILAAICFYRVYRGWKTAQPPRGWNEKPSELSKLA